MIDKMLGNPWLYALGFSGQLVFMTRFIVQWIASERRKRSVIPITFWYLSIGGAALLLVYAVMDRDPVFIVSQSLGIVVYFRNLVLLWREGTKECEAERAA
ncbi:MAG: lipid-A-disaccharide synthase N-terminal domain-containing protein [Planctomycetota bacterium]